MQTLLRGGRVIDPGTGLDEVADVLVDDGVVAAVGSRLTAEDAVVIDVTGLLVGPGFIDLHSHVHSIAGQRLQAMDGVTTSLDLEAGLMPVARAYTHAAQQGRPLHYGFSASWARPGPRSTSASSPPGASTRRSRSWAHPSGSGPPRPPS